MKRKELGKGLSALLPDPEPAGGEAALEAAVDSLEPNPFQPRTTIRPEQLQELAASIRESGMVQPILVRRHQGRYQIIAGERRWRAAQSLGLRSVPVTIRDVPDERLLELALVENIQREELQPLEEALAFQRLQEEFQLTQEEIARRVGRERPTIANTLRLLKLPPRVQALVQEGKLSAGAARALIGHPHIDSLVDQIIARGLSVREVEALAAGSGEGAAEPAGRVTGTQGAREPREKDADTRAFEKDLSDALGLRVEVQPGSGESGQLSIRYSNFEQLDYIRNRLLGMYA
jgi:ParB family chromosome partitioning protein